VPCFEIEGSGLRLTALTILPVETVVDGIDSQEKTVGKSGATETGRNGFI
jgi:hypothetical protein